MLKAFRLDRPKEIFKMSAWVIGFWMLWLSFVSTWPLPFGLKLSATSLVILFGSYTWGWWDGLAYLFVMSWIYGLFSIIPEGFFFVAMAIIFSLIKIISLRLSVTNIAELLIAVFLTTLGLDLVQALLLFVSEGEKVLSLPLFGYLLVSAAVHSLLGLVLARPLLGLMEAR